MTKEELTEIIKGFIGYELPWKHYVESDFDSFFMTGTKYALFYNYLQEEGLNIRDVNIYSPEKSDYSLSIFSVDYDGITTYFGIKCYYSSYSGYEFEDVMDFNVVEKRERQITITEWI